MKKAKKKPPTEKAIQAEIKALDKMKPNVRQFSKFGDDHHAAIEAQIEVMQNNLQEDEIYNNWEGAEHLLNNALDVRHWMDGEDFEAPSKEWAPLVKK